MDYSKLSNDELLALKAKDYSKLSNETILALKQSAPPAAAQPAAEPPKTWGQFGKNLASDYYQNVTAPFLSVPNTIVDAARGTLPTGADIVQGVKNIPANMAQSIMHPIESGYKRPVSTALDISSAVSLAADAANLGRMAAGGTVRALLPGTARATAGVPESLTKIALEKPQVFDRPPVPPEAVSETVGKPIQDALRLSKEKVQQVVGNAYRKYAGMEGPMQEIEQTPIAQTITPVKSDVPVAQKLNPVEERDLITNQSRTKLTPGDMVTERQVTGFKPGEEFAVQKSQPSRGDILVHKKWADDAFLKGDKSALDKLYREYVGTPKSDTSQLPITNSDRLQMLTRLKRAINQQVTFGKAPATLNPITSPEEAAFKKMASEVDDMRGKLPNGRRLAAVDDAYKEIHDLYDTVQKDVADPGKARDLAMRIARGDQTWLTNGKTENKINAIKRAERISGQSILKTAMEELTRQVYNDLLGKGMLSHLFKGGAVTTAAAAVANPALIPPAAVMAASSSPRFIRGAIRAGSSAGGAIQRGAGAVNNSLLAAMLANRAKKK